MDPKTPEQIAAEQKLEAQIKEAEEKAAQEKANADKAAAEAKAAQEKEEADKAAAEKAAADKAAQEQKAAEEKAAADKALEEKITRAGELHFVYKGDVYVPQVPRILIPGIGVRTALEICLDEEAQAYLVEKGGSVTKID